VTTTWNGTYWQPGTCGPHALQCFSLVQAIPGLYLADLCAELLRAREREPTKTTERGRHERALALKYDLHDIGASGSFAVSAQLAACDCGFCHPPV
jgi:hypothetical protein